MAPRIMFIFLCLWFLSMVTGCAVGPSRYDTLMGALTLSSGLWCFL
jgi:hypothetical protein